MTTFKRISPATLLAAFLLAASSFGQPDKTLTIGTKESVPFVIRAEDGAWEGVSVDLWRQIAEELQLTYEFEERDLEGLIAGLKDGSLDAVVAALTITAERETEFDFTHPFYSTGLAIATPPSGGGGWRRVAERLISYSFLTAIGALVLVLLVVGFLAYVLEHRRNPEQFGGGFWQGLWSGFWWSAVTMTTVGYGDKAPRTFCGRILGLIWMFTAVIIISGVTAAITSALTVTQLEARVRGPEDLPSARVGTVPGSTSAKYMQRNDIPYRGYDSVAAGLKAVAAGQIDAMVYDAPTLRYLVKSRFNKRVLVIPGTFERQDYGIGLAAGSPLREQINRVLLTRISRPSWREVLRQYLGG